MISLRHVIPVLGLTLGLAGAVYADTAPTTAPAATANPGAGPHWRGGHHGGPGGFFHVLRKLNLTPEQQTQVKSIFAQSKTQFQALHSSVRENHEALEVTPPTDSKYPALLATQKANAATALQQVSDIKSQIYALLTPAQISQIPVIIAAEKADRAARIAAWRAKHAAS